MNFKKILIAIALVIMLSTVNFAEEESKFSAYFDNELNLYGLKDAEDNIILKPTYDYISDFLNGFAIVQTDDHTGAIDESGKLVVPLEYDEISYFKNGNALALKDGKIGMISKNNEIVHEFIWDAIDMLD